MFVILWSTGFIGMRLGTPHAEPFTFMSIRMWLVTSIFALAVMVLRPVWPENRRALAHAAIAGLLVHATYLAGILYAIRWQLPLALVALIAGLQPILTAWLMRKQPGESLGVAQWGGMLVGFGGLAIVISGGRTDGEIGIPSLAAAIIGLIGITLGTIHQKRHVGTLDMRVSGLIQFGSTAIMLTLGAFLFESRVVNWTGEFVFALAWLTLVLSLGAISLLYFMIQRGAASRVASLFFLTPGVTALMAWLLFGEVLSSLALVGLGVSAVGVALVMQRPKQ
jgi:drug/metabolite transporter (DMT)-like permease